MDPSGKETLDTQPVHTHADSLATSCSSSSASPAATTLPAETSSTLGCPKKRVRLRCTWGGCTYKAQDDPDLTSVPPLASSSPPRLTPPPPGRLLTRQGTRPPPRSQHLGDHRRCSKPDCPWLGAREEKDKLRHVWKHHRKWAAEQGLPSIKGRCDECGKEFARRDYVPRHKLEVHGRKKRSRNKGG